MLKEELRNLGQNADQERSLTEHSLQILRDDLANAKLSLAECNRRENMVILSSSLSSLIN